jgi:hypothetical protein
VSEQLPRVDSKKPAAKWTIERVRSLGTVTNVVTAGAALGIGRNKAYELAKLGHFPVRTLKVGRRYVVPVAGIVELLTGERPTEKSS